MMTNTIVCRLCLEENRNVLTELKKSNQLITTICTFTSLLVLQHPTTSVIYLCGECENLLVRFDLFRESCLANDKIFRKRIEDGQLQQTRERSKDLDLEIVKIESIILDEYQSPRIPGEEKINKNKSKITPVRKGLRLKSIDTQGKSVQVKKTRTRRNHRATTSPDGNTSVQTTKETNSGTSRRLLPCTQCGKMIVRENMKKHMFTHNPDAPLKYCSHCGKGYKDSYLLKVHVNSHHTFETKYECDVCGKVYLRPNSLREHVLANHSTEKRYECAVCGLKFANFSKKSYHYTTVHTTVKPFTCQYCDKSFKFKNDLTLHTRTHTGEKPFACDICGKSFAKSYNVVIHKKFHENQMHKKESEAAAEESESK